MKNHGSLHILLNNVKSRGNTFDFPLDTGHFITVNDIAKGWEWEKPRSDRGGARG